MKKIRLFSAGLLLLLLLCGAGALFFAPPATLETEPPKPPAHPTLRLSLNKHALPYEETLEFSLENSIKQVDYAITQALLSLGFSPELIRDLKVSRWESGGGANSPSYFFQELQIPLGRDLKAFDEALADCLPAWAPQAELKREAGSGPGESWLIFVHSLPTHHLLLLPDGFHPPPPAPPSPPTLEDRLRKPGEQAVLVVVLDDIGESMPALHTLLNLNFPVTLAIWPYSAHAAQAARAAHAAGLDVLVHQPMEPLDYPKVKPGPGVLLQSMPPQAIRAGLEASLTRVPYAIGVNNHMGSRFTQNATAMAPVLNVLKEKRLIALDSLTHPASRFYAGAKAAGLASFRRDVFLDVNPAESAVLAQLRHAEKLALKRGRAIAIGHPLPGTLAALKTWQKQRNPEVKIVKLHTLTP